MSDQDRNTDDDRVVARALDAWTPLEPPVDFADRVLAARVPFAPRAAKRAWWIAAPIAAVAMIALVLFFATQRSMNAAATEPGVSAQHVAENGMPVDLLAPAGSASPGSGALIAAGSGSASIAMNQPYGTDAGVANLPTAVDDAETDIAIIAGTSVTIHDPSPITALHIDFSAQCPTGGHVIVSDARDVEVARASGRTRAVLTVEVGRWPYEVRCDADPRALPVTGTITVQSDAADRKLPKLTRAVNTIDADGRTWRVSYQTVTPDIRVRAPKATHVRFASAGVETELAVIGGVAKLPPLAPGTYTYWALAPSGPTKVSTLIIDVDHTAPRIYLGKLRSSSNSAMILEGVAAPGWTLSMNGDPITIRADRHFEVSARGFKRVVIRAEHPALGVHYFATLPITR
jgi:hypothetical protein